MAKESERYGGVRLASKIPQTEKNLAGIPAFVCKFLNVSEAAPCPPFLHTSY